MLFIAVALPRRHCRPGSSRRRRRCRGGRRDPRRGSSRGIPPRRVVRRPRSRRRCPRDRSGRRRGRGRARRESRRWGRAPRSCVLSIRWSAASPAGPAQRPVRRGVSPEVSSLPTRAGLPLRRSGKVLTSLRKATTAFAQFADLLEGSRLARLGELTEPDWCERSGEHGHDRDHHDHLADAVAAIAARGGIAHISPRWCPAPGRSAETPKAPGPGPRRPSASSATAR